MSIRRCCAGVGGTRAVGRRRVVCGGGTWGALRATNGEAKSWHGLARAVRRGMENMRIQAYLTATAVNLKRLAAAVAARIFALWRACAARRRRMRVPRGLTRRLATLSQAA